MAKTRQPVKQLSGMHVAKLVKQDEQAKRAERAAKAAAKRADREQAKLDAKAKADAERVEQEQAAADRVNEQAAGVLSAQRVDFDALTEAGSWTGTFAEYLREQGFDDQGHSLQAHNAKTPYNGPMIALKTARKSYVKAANGILCNGSPLAMLCGQYKREVVVAALIDALKLPGNPYLSLNPGQQSMNLRNKARHALIECRLSLGEVEAHLKAHAAE